MILFFFRSKAFRSELLLLHKSVENDRAGRPPPAASAAAAASQALAAAVAASHHDREGYHRRLDDVAPPAIR